jgi:hypothetical protein
VHARTAPTVSVKRAEGSSRKHGAGLPRGADTTMSKGRATRISVIWSIRASGASSMVLASSPDAPTPARTGGPCALCPRLSSTGGYVRALATRRQMSSYTWKPSWVSALGVGGWPCNPDVAWLPSRKGRQRARQRCAANDDASEPRRESPFARAPGRRREVAAVRGALAPPAPFFPHSTYRTASAGGMRLAWRAGHHVAANTNRNVTATIWRMSSHGTVYSTPSASSASVLATTPYVM